jgi:hypothetical protein
VKSFLVLFFKKEPLAFWAGTEATPIPQESGSGPVGINKQFFFEKENQKTFSIWRELPRLACTRGWGG